MSPVARHPLQHPPHQIRCKKCIRPAYRTTWRPRGAYIDPELRQHRCPLGHTTYAIADDEVSQ